MCYASLPLVASPDKVWGLSLTHCTVDYGSYRLLLKLGFDLHGQSNPFFGGPSLPHLFSSSLACQVFS